MAELKNCHRCNACGTALIHTDETCPQCTRPLAQSERPSPPVCSICNTQIAVKPGSFLQNLKDAGTVGIKTTDDSRFILFDGTLCLCCYRLLCFNCHDWTKLGTKCTICGGNLNILSVSNYRLWTAKQTRAVRIIIAYMDSTCPQAEEITAIVNEAWDGRLANDTKITAYPISEHDWSSDKDLAYAWKALLSVLEFRDREHTFWKTHLTKALLGRVSKTGQRFYVQTYYE